MSYKRKYFESRKIVALKRIFSDIFYFFWKSYAFFIFFRIFFCRSRFNACILRETQKALEVRSLAIFIYNKTNNKCSNGGIRANTLIKDFPGYLVWFIFRFFCYLGTIIFFQFCGWPWRKYFIFFIFLKERVFFLDFCAKKNFLHDFVHHLFSEIYIRLFHRIYGTYWST